MSKKPTIADLEKILDGPAQQIDILPTGELRARTQDIPSRIVHSGLDKIQELEPNIIPDIMGAGNTQQKVNEIIKVVNHIIKIIGWEKP